MGKNAQWTTEAIDEIYTNIDTEYGNCLHHHTIAVNKSVKSPVEIDRYDIVLVAICDDIQFNVNDLLVSLEFAEYDPSTEHHLKNIPRLLEHDESDLDSDWEKDIDVERQNPWPHTETQSETHTKTPTETNAVQSIDEDFNFDESFVNFDEEDLFELFPSLKDQVQRKADTSTPNPPTLQRIDEEEAEMVSIENKNVLTEQTVRQLDHGYISAEADGTDASSSEYYNIGHRVEYICKRPKVTWWQTAESLILRIGAQDNVKYELEVTTDHLIYL